MHEASIAQSIIDQLLEKKAEGIFEGKLTSVHLKIGKLTAIVPDNLIFLYSVLTEETPLTGSHLEIEMIPVRCQCQKCHLEFEIDELEFWCPECSATNVKVITGRELLITALEVDDAD